MKQKTLRRIMKLNNEELVNERNPADGCRTIKGPLPIISPGPNYILHFDQYEKLTPYGITIYAGRDRHAGYVLPFLALRNKNQESVYLSWMGAYYHLRGITPYKSQFDGGTECNKIKQHFWKLSGATINGVKTGTSTQNQVIELWWNDLHRGVIWIYRVEMRHLVFHDLLDPVIGIHQSCIWSVYAHIVQFKCDEFADIYNSHRMYVHCIIYFLYS